MSKKLFVGNLPFDVNDADLATVLAVAGTVASAKIVINKKTGRSKGYGFVEMETEEVAAEAIKKFEGATLNERPLTVQLATPKQEAQAQQEESGTASPGDTPHSRLIHPKAASNTEVTSAEATHTEAAAATDTSGSESTQAST
jgi:RNA recognition motif-containing protein